MTTRKELAARLREEVGKSNAMGWEFVGVESVKSVISYIDQAEAEIERLEDELKCSEFNLENKSKEIGRSEHRGNTVDYIYDKCTLYSKQLLAVVDENQSLKSRIAELEANETENDVECSYQAIRLMLLRSFRKALGVDCARGWSTGKLILEHLKSEWNHHSTVHSMTKSCTPKSNEEGKC